MTERFARRTSIKFAAAFTFTTCSIACFRRLARFVSTMYPQKPSSTTPTITLYRSDSKSQEADELKAFLATTDYSVVEKNVSQDPGTQTDESIEYRRLVSRAKIY